MTTRFNWRNLATDAIPALVVVAVVSIVMSRSVDELRDRLPALLLAGLCGVALSTILVGRVSDLSSQSVAQRSADELDLDDVFVASPARGLESFSLAKEGSADNENEDSLRLNEDLGLVAISDGASSSFGARVWSRALVDTAATLAGPIRARLVGHVVEQAAVAWHARHSDGKLEWWAQEGLRRGAFATLLMVSIGEHSGGRCWRAVAVGDSCLLHLRRSAGSWQLARSFPVETAEGFGSHPALLSSVNTSTAGTQVASGELVRGDVLIAATDAISEWMLRDFTRLAFVAEAPVTEVLSAARDARQSKAMVNDDVTFVRFRQG